SVSSFTSIFVFMFNCICTIFTPEYYPIYSQFCTFLSNHFCTLLEYHLYMARGLAPWLANLLRGVWICSMTHGLAPWRVDLLHGSRICSLACVIAPWLADLLHGLRICSMSRGLDPWLAYLVSCYICQDNNVHI